MCFAAVGAIRTRSHLYNHWKQQHYEPHFILQNPTNTGQSSLKNELSVSLFVFSEN